MAQMPDIKPEINKEPERDKKRGGGFLARLFGGGSGGGSMAAGGFGAGAGGGGLLATKAGLLAMILVGTTVAGGIGMVGYRLFGPGSEQGDGGMTLFAVKPKEATASSSDAQNAAPKDGSSASLDYLAKANSAPKEPELKPTEAPKDASAANAAPAPEAAANGSANGPINAAGSAGNGVSKGMLKTGGKFGELSKNFGGGGGGAVAGGSPAKAGSSLSNADALAAGSKNGQSTGMKKGVTAMGGGSRAVASRKGANTGMRQALGALADNRGATTSYGAGRTYDGSAAQNTGNIGPTGGEIGMGGQGDTTGQQPKSMPNTANQNKEFKAPPTPDAVMAAPWQKAINTAQMLAGAAALLLLLAAAIAKTGPTGITIAKVIGWVVCVMGAAVIALGAQIAGGEYGQKVQGGWLMAAGAGLMVAGAMAGLQGYGSQASTTSTAAPAPGAAPAAAEASSASGAAGGASGGSAGFMGISNPWVLLGGGIALGGLIGSMMTPPTKYPSKQFENGNPPDTHFFGYKAPSDEAVDKMFA